MKKMNLFSAKKTNPICPMYVDIDICEKELPAKMVWEKIASDCIGEKFPPPSLVLASGQGLQLLWLISDAPNAIQRYRRIEMYLRETLHSLGGGSRGPRHCPHPSDALCRKSKK